MKTRILFVVTVLMIFLSSCGKAESSEEEYVFYDPLPSDILLKVVESYDDHTLKAEVVENIYDDNDLLFNKGDYVILDYSYLGFVIDVSDTENNYFDMDDEGVLEEFRNEKPDAGEYIFVIEFLGDSNCVKNDEGIYVLSFHEPMIYNDKYYKEMFKVWGIEE